MDCLTVLRTPKVEAPRCPIVFAMGAFPTLSEAAQLRRLLPSAGPHRQDPTRNRPDSATISAAARFAHTVRTSLHQRVSAAGRVRQWKPRSRSTLKGKSPPLQFQRPSGTTELPTRPTQPDAPRRDEFSRTSVAERTGQSVTPGNSFALGGTRKRPAIR